MRINRFLAKCGLGSRRKVEELILQGKVKVNDEVIKNLATKVNPEKDIVKFQNNIVKPIQEKIYIKLNKPMRYLVTKNDPYNRRTIFDLLPDFSKMEQHNNNLRLFPVGRLDYKSEGLIIVTNDGKFANRIIHPKFKLKKVYRVKVKGKIDIKSLWQLRNGINLDGQKTLPAKVFIDNYNKNRNITKLRMIIYEGRNRQIRRMVKEIGLNVLRIKRVRIGQISLAKLPVGSWSYLKDKEIRWLN